MRRFLAFLLRNWPLKVGAVLLATVLYGGIVLSEGDRRWPGRVVIEPVGVPPGATLLGVLPEITSITYRADLDVASQLTNGSFRARVDVSRIEPQMGGLEVSVPVTLHVLDSGVQIVSFEPTTVPVRLDPVVSEEMPVDVEYDAPPPGLQIGTPRARPSMVTVEGASSRVNDISKIEARVTIDASGRALNVDQEVDLVPLDVDGNEVQAVELTPARVRVTVAVAPLLANATVPVNPDLQGELPAGHVLAGVSTEPLAVTVSGSRSVIDLLQTATTAPVDVSGRTESFETEVVLALPAGLTSLGPASVTVRVTIEPQRGSQTYQVGVVPRGARDDRIYTLSAPSVNVKLAGPAPYLAALDPATLVAAVDVGRLEPGSHGVDVKVLEEGPVSIVAVEPASIQVVVAEIPPSPTPSAVIPTPTPTAAP